MTAPVMQIRHDMSDTHDVWWVAARWPDGRIEDIKDFKSETDANEWIANELDAWLSGNKQTDIHAQTMRYGNKVSV